MNRPDPPFRHLLRLTDRVGVLEHAEGVVPRHEHGYCTDDIARGLVVTCREPSPPGHGNVVGAVAVLMSRHDAFGVLQHADAVGEPEQVPERRSRAVHATAPS